MGFQDRLHSVAEHEVGVADDAGGDLGGAVLAAGALGGETLDELDFADAPHFLGSRGAIHRMALDEYGLRDVVSAAEIVGELVEQVAVALAVPEMMVRVADGEVGFDGFLCDLREPCLALGRHVLIPLPLADDAKTFRRMPSFPLSRERRVIFATVNER